MNEITEPLRIARLSHDRHGRPVPFFVKWIDGEPDFRVMDMDAFVRAVKLELCWICGQPLGALRSFTIGPMCAVNRTSAEPPGHTSCAEYSAQVCPFLTTPGMRRRKTGIEDAVPSGGVMIERNPGVTLVWTARRYEMYRDPEGGVLFDIGEPVEVSWWSEGRPATRDEVVASIKSGLPTLQEIAEEEGRRALDELERRTVAAMELGPS